tara:strand:- start:10227 stop:11201 length:975 start_codon:yes stop_codon:yes gene_type:complete
MFWHSAEAANSAVVIMYHRFGEDNFPSTSIRIKQFEAHIAELSSGKYNVLPLVEITARMREGRPLPDRTLGISIDDAYLSVYTEAWPRLKAAGLPFTIFAPTARLDQRSATNMTWEQLRQMHAQGADVGHHTVSHPHMPVASGERLEKEITRANERFQIELGYKPELFAYPYGEASAAIIERIKQAGFMAAFGQHSGVIGSSAENFYLPRFSMSDKYGDLDRLKLAINALPLVVSDITPTDHFIGSEARNPPAIGFTINADIKQQNSLSCFLSHAGRANVEKLGATRVEIRVQSAFPRGRTRLNCTMRTPDGRWRWYGRQFFRP